MVESRSTRRRGARLTIDDFRAKPEYDGEGHRIDLAYPVYARSHGVSPAAVRSAMLPVICQARP
jgi:hypothetical protein